MTTYRRDDGVAEVAPERAMTTYRRDDGVAEVASCDRVTLLLVHEPGRPPIALTGSAVSIWEELGAEPCELQQVVSAVAKRCQVSEWLVESDVRSLCRQLAQAGFLVPEDDDRGAAR